MLKDYTGHNDYCNCKKKMQRSEGRIVEDDAVCRNPDKKKEEHRHSPEPKPCSSAPGFSAILSLLMHKLSLSLSVISLFILMHAYCFSFVYDLREVPLFAPAFSSISLLYPFISKAVKSKHNILQHCHHKRSLITHILGTTLVSPRILETIQRVLPPHKCDINPCNYDQLCVLCRSLHHC